MVYLVLLAVLDDLCDTLTDGHARDAGLRPQLLHQLTLSLKSLLELGVHVHRLVGRTITGFSATGGKTSGSLVILNQF